MNRPRLLLRDEQRRWWLAASVTGWVAVLVAAAALILRQLDVSWQPLVVLASGAHQLLWAAPVAVALFLIARLWFQAGVAAIVLVLAVVSQLGLYIGNGGSSTGPTLAVLQANLKVGAADAASVVRLAQGADVAMLEELTTGERARLAAAGIDRALPSAYTAVLPDGGGGLGIWSRYPLSDEHNYPGYQLGVLSAVAATPHGPVTVVAVHVLPPYPYAPSTWRGEIARLRGLLGDLAKARRPVIVAGDFNATTDNAQFRALLHGYVDAAEVSGAGYHPTYPTDRWFGPVIAIDHVLAYRARPRRLHTVTLPGSDHRGLSVSVGL